MMGGPLAHLPRPTIERLECYVRLLLRWNARINLIGPSTIDDVWVRHVEEAAALWTMHPLGGRWLDIGTGGGLPGVVVALVAGDAVEMALVESDARKCAFLASVRRELALPLTIHGARAEALAPQHADVVTARALAPLSTLLALLRRHGRSDGIGLFPKGAAWEDEVREARRTWAFDLDVLRADPSGGSVVLKVWEPHER